MLENTEGAIKKGQYKETGKIGYTRRRKRKQKHNTICVGHHYAQTNTTNVNKTCTLLQTTEGKDEPNIVNKTCTLLQTTGGKDEPNIDNKTCTLLQTTGGKDEPNIVHAEIAADIMTRN
jgi:hypothetical protein